MDTGVDIPILTEMVFLHFLHWKFRSGPPIIGVGGQQDSKFTTRPVRWKDLDSNKGAIHPIVL